MGFGRGFGGTPSRTDGGKKTVNTVARPTIDLAATTLTVDDLKKGIIYFSNSDRDTITVDLSLPATAQELS